MVYGHWPAVASASGRNAGLQVILLALLCETCGVDPASLAVETVTAVIAALDVMFSRLDARRSGRREELGKVSIRDGLDQLGWVLLTWAYDALKTNNAVSAWLADSADDDQLRQALHRTAVFDFAGSQLADAKEVAAVLATVTTPGQSSSAAGRGSRWQPLRQLLAVYAPELAGLLEEVFRDRRELLAELSETLVGKNPVPEQVASRIGADLTRTAEGLRRAHRMVSDHAAKQFPLSISDNT